MTFNLSPQGRSKRKLYQVKHSGTATDTKIDSIVNLDDAIASMCSTTELLSRILQEIQNTTFADLVNLFLYDENTLKFTPALLDHNSDWSETQEYQSLLQVAKNSGVAMLKKGSSLKKYRGLPESTYAIMLEPLCYGESFSCIVELVFLEKKNINGPYADVQTKMRSSNIKIYLNYITLLLGRSAFDQLADNISFRLSSMQEVVQKMSVTQDIGQLLSEIVRLATVCLYANLAWIGLKREDSVVIKPDAYCGIDGEYLNKIILTYDDTLYGNGPSGKAIKTKEMQIVRDTQKDPGFEPWKKEARKCGYRSIIASPLIYRGEVLGVIVVYSNRIDAFTSADVDILRTFAGHAAIAICQSRLFEQKEKSLAQLKKLNEAVNSQNEILKWAISSQNKLTEMVLKGENKNTIAQSLAEMVGNPVAVEDRFSDFVAWASPNDRLINLDELLQGQIGRIAGMSELRQEVQILTEKRCPVYIPKNKTNQLSFSRLVAPILVENELWGFLSIIEKGRKIEETDYMIIDKASMVLAMSLLTEKTAFSVEQNVKGEWLRDLVTNLVPDDVITKRVAYLNYDLSMSSYLILVDVEGVPMKELQNNLDYAIKAKITDVIKRVVNSIYSSSLIIVEEKLATILIPAVRSKHQMGDFQNDLNLASRIQEELRSYFPNCPFSVGLGGEYNSVKDLRRVYQEANDALEIINSLNRQGDIVSLDDLGMYTILFKCKDRELLKQFYRRLIGRLEDYEERSGTPLLDTLALFLKYKGCSQNVARDLFIHPNTLTYRIRRIEEILQAKLKDFEFCCQLQLALKARDLVVNAE